MRKRIGVLTKIGLLSCVLLLVFTGCSNDKKNGDNDSVIDEGEIVENSNLEVSQEYKLLSGTEGGKIYSFDPDKANYSLKIDAADEVHDISEMLFGIFFEDINFAADGGLYAEMIQNRSFEFTKLASGDELHAWNKMGNCEVRVEKNDNENLLNESNPNYVVIKNEDPEGKNGGISNSGFLDGMSIEEGKAYNFSFYARMISETPVQVTVSLNAGNKSVGNCTIDGLNNEWVKYTGKIVSSKTAYSAVTFSVEIPGGAEVAFDMISLFPEDTYNGRENGLRKDLVEALIDLAPAFIRFPGGCVTEGNPLQYAYDWKSSVGIDQNREPLLFNGRYGDVATRKQGQNIWTNTSLSEDKYPSYMSYGLGFYEYFLLAEDIGAVGVPVLNCGMSCQGRDIKTVVPLGSAQMQRYIDDALDLVEFCRGDESTTWGKVRISMGHKEPFALKYICIGNEQVGNDYYSHYKAFVEAFDKAKAENPAMYGDIELIYSAGFVAGGGGDYEKSYVYAENWVKQNPEKELSDFAGATDHHYYNSPDWFLSHTNYYDEENYTRNTKEFTDPIYCGGINVFLGEYAAKSNTLRAALAEAAYMTGLERNGDIVKMAAYAPLFGNTTACHWSPDLIWFNNRFVTPSVNYYVQQIFSKNAGTKILNSQMDATVYKGEELSGKVGVATWSTTAKFSNIKITNNDTGEVLAFDDFASEDSLKNWEFASDGDWAIEDGALVQSKKNTDVNKYANTGAVAYFGDVNWTNYTYELDAQKTGGDEGFLIPFAVKDKNNNYFWNIGGWGNTVSCLQYVEGGTKSGQVDGTIKSCKVVLNKVNHLKIVVEGSKVSCYINSVKFVSYDSNSQKTYETYQVVSTDENGDIIVKMVNVTNEPKTFAISIDGIKGVVGDAVLESVAGEAMGAENLLGRTPLVSLKEYTVGGISDKFNLEVPKYSVTVLRIRRQ